MMPIISKLDVSDINGVDIKPSEIRDIEFSLDNVHANATSNMTLLFIVDNALEKGDKLHINFPRQNLKWSTGVYIHNSYPLQVLATSSYCCNTTNGSFVINKEVDEGQRLNVTFSYVGNRG